jgi:ABC-type Mn2+/Zn2+ transport system permease subunit
MRSMMILSVLVAAVCTLGGLLLSYAMNVPSGATIILLATGGYGLMLLERWRTGRRAPPAAAD